MTRKQGELGQPQESGGGLLGPDRKQDSLQDRQGGPSVKKTPERLQRHDDPDNAQHTLTEYIQPGNRSCDETVNKLISTLDNPEIAEAMLESDAQEDTDFGRFDEEENPRRKPH
jgi:hypothetical protein